VLCERREIDDAHALAHEAAFIAHMREIVGAAKAPLILARNSRRCKPVRPLPSVALSPHGTQALELVVYRTRLRRSRGGPLLVGKMDGKDAAVGFFVFLHNVAFACVGAEAARIHRQHVNPGLARRDPFSELPAGAARGRDAEAVAFIDPHIRHAPRGPDQRAAVGRIGNGAVDDVLDAAVLEGRHPPDGSFDVRQQPIKVRLKEAPAEPVWHAIGKARWSAGLVRSQNPSQALLAQIVGLVGLAQHRKLPATFRAIAFELRGLIVNDVLMLDGDGRNIEPKEPSGLAGVVAGGAHDVFGCDLALVGCQAPLTRGGAYGARHLRVLVNLGTTGARAFAQCHGEIRRCDVAIVRVIQRTDDVGRACAIAEIHQRPQLSDFFGSDDLIRHADGVGRAAVLLVLVHARRAGG